MDLTAYPRTPRLVNRYKMGADPEFVFFNEEGKYIHAENLGLTTLTAFGCDMAGRQAELRVYPSRFVLELVASAMDTLRWMSIANSATRRVTWCAPAYVGKDGCGGHIHVGRRRPDREDNIDHLDVLMEAFVGSGVFDADRFRRRQVLTPYGKFGDFRPQTHGYEYRTPPTQLSSPWLMYLTFTLAKLIVYEGRLKAATNAIALLTKYEDLDDDAAIAKKALSIHGLPKDNASDFKEAWGVPTVMSPRRSLPLHWYVPSVIEPTHSTCEELFQWLTQGTKIPLTEPEPTWTPVSLPAGFTPVAVQPHTLGHLPDIGMNLVARNILANVDVIGDKKLVITRGKDLALPKKAIRDTLQGVFSEVRFQDGPNGYLTLSVPSGAHKKLPVCKLLNKVLGDPRLFPVCKAKNLHTTDWSIWDKASTETVKPLLGREVAKVKGIKKVRIQEEIDF